jgi:hypothetical protein
MADGYTGDDYGEHIEKSEFFIEENWNQKLRR